MFSSLCKVDLRQTSADLLCPQSSVCPRLIGLERIFKSFEYCQAPGPVQCPGQGPGQGPMSSPWSRLGSGVNSGTQNSVSNSQKKGP